MLLIVYFSMSWMKLSDLLGGYLGIIIIVIIIIIIIIIIIKHF
jgi:hypothetical protein